MVYATGCSLSTCIRGSPSVCHHRGLASVPTERQSTVWCCYCKACPVNRRHHQLANGRQQYWQLRLSVYTAERSSPETTSNSSGDEIANVYFFTTTSSTTFTQCAPEATKFGEITQNEGHYAVQGHSRSPNRFWYQSKLIYDFLLVINSNLPHILHCFRDIAFDESKSAIFGYPYCVPPADGRVPLGRSP